MRYSATMKFSNLGAMRIAIPAMSATRGASGIYIAILPPMHVLKSLSKSIPYLVQNV
jgi:hypothetical protein